MRLSISNIAWTSGNDLKMYQNLVDFGFCGIEIAPTRLFSEKPYDNLDEAAKIRTFLSNNFGLCVSSIQSIWYGKTLRIAESTETMAELMNYTLQALTFAEAIGCSNLVFGCPRNRRIVNERDNAINESFFLQAADAAQKHNVVISLEPNPPIYNTNYINTTGQAIELLERLHHPNLMLNLDLGTIIANGEDLDIITDKIYLIHHIHISEPGLGLIRPRLLHNELKERLSHAGYRGFVSIEMGAQKDLQSVLRTMDYVSKIFC